MPVLARMLASPLFVDIRRGAVEDLSDLLHERYISATGAVLVAVGPSQGQEIWRRIADSLPEAEVFEVADASLASAGELQQVLGRRSYDAVVGIGGGRTLDVAKYAATRAAVPMVAVATNLAHDGLCSPVASLEHPHGKGSFGVALPLAVLVDLDYVRAAPPRLVRAGVGDVVSNLSALADWSLAAEHRGEPVDGLAVGLRPHGRGGRHPPHRRHRGRELPGLVGRGPGAVGDGHVGGRDLASVQRCVPRDRARRGRDVRRLRPR